MSEGENDTTGKNAVQCGKGDHATTAGAASLFLMLLFIGDFVYIAMHAAWTFTFVLDSPLSALDAERGFAEVFQYVKTLWIVAMLVWVGLRTRTPGYLAWALLFFYLLCDDSLSIHENLGAAFALRLDLRGGFGLRGQDFGELLVSALAGAALAAVIALAYQREAAGFRRASHHLLVLVLIIAFLGIAVDMLAIAVVDRYLVLDFVMTVLEDGGEMLAMSLAAWYAFLLVIRNGTIGGSLRQLVAAAAGKARSRFSYGPDVVRFFS